MDELLIKIREQWEKPAQCAQCNTENDLHHCSSCKTIFCSKKCQIIGDMCLIGGKRAREKKKGAPKTVVLTKDVYSIIVKFLQLDDLKNVSLATKKLTMIARQEMINTYRWRYTREVMQLIKPRKISVDVDNYDDYQNDPLIFGTELITEVFFTHGMMLQDNSPVLPQSVKRVYFDSIVTSIIDLTDLPVLEEIVFFEEEDDNLFFNGILLLPPNLIELTLGRGFNSDLNLPDSLKLLVFPEDSLFNRPLVLPPNLTYLWFGGEQPFNQPIILPNNLEVLHVSNSFNQPITFPESLRSISLGYDFAQPIDNWPQNLSYIRVMNDSHEYEFPPNVKLIELARVYVNENSIIILPGSTRKTKITIL
jgi:hypothetical protein